MLKSTHIVRTSTQEWAALSKPYARRRRAGWWSRTITLVALVGLVVSATAAWCWGFPIPWMQTACLAVAAALAASSWAIVSAKENRLGRLQDPRLEAQMVESYVKRVLTTPKARQK